MRRRAIARSGGPASYVLLDEQNVELRRVRRPDHIGDLAPRQLRAELARGEKVVCKEPPRTEVAVVDVLLGSAATAKA